jgi:hypothetical protein
MIQQAKSNGPVAHGANASGNSLKGLEQIAQRILAVGDRFRLSDDHRHIRARAQLRDDGEGHGLYVAANAATGNRSAHPLKSRHHAAPTPCLKSAAISGSDRSYPITSSTGEAWASAGCLLPFDKLNLNALPD